MFLVVLLLHTEPAEDPLCLVLFQLKAAQCTAHVTGSSRNSVVQSCSKYLEDMDVRGLWKRESHHISPKAGHTNPGCMGW